MKFHSFLENIHFMIFEFHSIQKNIHFLTRALYSIQNFIQFKENPCHSFKKTIHLFEKSFIEHPYLTDKIRNVVFEVLPYSMLFNTTSRKQTLPSPSLPS